MAHLDTLPYQEGKPISTIPEEGTVLIDYSSDEHTSHRHVYMAEVDAEGEGNPNELLEQISGDENTANAGDENNAGHDACRLRNQKRVTRRRNTAERQRHL